jgi:hypothetical protein
MAPPRKAIKETPGWTIYCALLKYADGKQMIPNANAFFKYLVEQEVLAETDGSLYRYYMERRLVDDGYIQIDHAMHSIRIMDRQIVPVTPSKPNEDETDEQPLVKKRLEDWQ